MNKAATKTHEKLRVDGCGGRADGGYSEVVPAPVAENESGGDEYQNHQDLDGSENVLHTRGTADAQAIEDGERSY